MSEFVILVDEYDKELGTCEKLEAHQKGLLHRAFSVILFNEHNHMLLQQRADEKYHSPGLWSNACCSHPRPNEDMKSAVKRRLQEELGVETEVQEIDKFEYRAEFENGLIEHELDYVFTGFVSEFPKANPEEVKDLKFISQIELEQDMNANPEAYTVWFRLIMDRLAKKKVVQ